MGELASIANIGLVVVLPAPDGAIDPEDRKHLAGLYKKELLDPVVYDMDFFDPEDGFVITITLSSGVRLVGYFDITDSDFYIDDGFTSIRAEFTTQTIPLSENLVGDTVTIEGHLYRVNSVLPNGTGVMTLGLLRTS